MKCKVESEKWKAFPLYTLHFPLPLCVLLILLTPGLLFSQEDDDADLPDASEIARKYRTREERRKAGLKYSLNEWITLSGLVESEYLYESEPVEDEFSAMLQLGLEATPLSWAKFELVYEYDAATNEQVLDEAILGLEGGDFDVETGLVNVSFGEYFSHFVTGPFLEFGETRAIGGVLSYTPEEQFDVSAFVYNGNAEQIETGTGNWDWGFSTEYSPFRAGTFAVSYISDIADSEHGFLDEFDDQYQQRVPALSGYALIGHGAFEVTGEVVHALRSFRELDSDFDQPSAWNVELAYYPKHELELALRFEHTSELEDAPRSRAGLGATWRALKNVYFSLEYLHGRFEEAGGSHYVAARVSIL